MTNTDIEIVVQPAESRQIARVLEFNSTTAPHIKLEQYCHHGERVGRTL